MIFQRSHQLQSSGNSLLLLLSLIMLLSACGTTKKSRRAPVRPKPEKEKVQKPIPKIDTVEWVLKEDRLPIDDETPPKTRRLPESEMKSSYKVDLMMPFKSKAFKVGGPGIELDAFRTRFINYYAGIKMAISDLEKKSVYINLNVHDTEYDEDVVRNMFFNGTFRDSDLLIGPYKRESVKWVSDRAKLGKTTQISPWISSSSIAEENPYYIQIKPGLIHHYETMLYQVSQRKDDGEIYLVVKEGDTNKERYLALAASEIGLDPEQPMYDVLPLIPDSLTYGELGFDSTFFQAQDCRKVFIVPYASSKDAGFVYDFLRKLQIEGSDCEYVVYGMYKWLDYRDQMFELLNTMDVHLTVSNLVNHESLQVKNFKLRYFNEYGAYPSDDAYEGYDMMMYIGTSLDKYGNKFQFVKEAWEPFTGIQTVYDITPIRNQDSDELDYFENRFIDLISIKDFKFQRSSQ